MPGQEPAPLVAPAISAPPGMSPSPQHEPPASAARTYRMQGDAPSGSPHTCRHAHPCSKHRPPNSPELRTGVGETNRNRATPYPCETSQRPAVAKIAALTDNARALYATIQRHYVQPRAHHLGTQTPPALLAQPTRRIAPTRQPDDCFLGPSSRGSNQGEPASPRSSSRAPGSPRGMSPHGHHQRPGTPRTNAVR